MRPYLYRKMRDLLRETSVCKAPSMVPGSSSSWLQPVILRGMKPGIHRLACSECIIKTQLQLRRLDATQPCTLTD